MGVAPTGAIGIAADYAGFRRTGEGASRLTFLSGKVNEYCGAFGATGDGWQQSVRLVIRRQSRCLALNFAGEPCRQTLPGAAMPNSRKTIQNGPEAAPFISSFIQPDSAF
jgi:hypothetical protein